MNEGEVGLPPTDRYRYADEIGGRLYLGGQVLDGRGMPTTGAAGQARQCLDKPSQRFVALQDTHHLRIHVVGGRSALVEGWDTVVACFRNGVPLATLLGVSTLGHNGQLVEIDAERRTL